MDQHAQQPLGCYESIWRDGWRTTRILWPPPKSIAKLSKSDQPLFMSLSTATGEEGSDRSCSQICLPLTFPGSRSSLLSSVERKMNGHICMQEFEQTKKRYSPIAHHLWLLVTCGSAVSPSQTLLILNDFSCLRSSHQLPPSPAFLLLSDEFLSISFGLGVPRTDSCLHQPSSPCHVRIAWYLYSDTSGLNPSLVTYNLVIWWHIIWAAFWAQLFLEKWESVAQFTELRIEVPVAHGNQLGTSLYCTA